MIFIDYLYWHYFVAPTDIAHLLRGYLLGAWRRFLIPRHWANLFAPWPKVLPRRNFHKTWGDVFAKNLVNLVSRALGLILRLAITAWWLITEAFYLLLFLFFIAIWIFWPVIVLWSMAKGLKLIL